MYTSQNCRLCIGGIRHTDVECKEENFSFWKDHRYSLVDLQNLREQGYTDSAVITLAKQRERDTIHCINCTSLFPAPAIRETYADELCVECRTRFDAWVDLPISWPCPDGKVRTFYGGKPIDDGGPV